MDLHDNCQSVVNQPPYYLHSWLRLNLAPMVITAPFQNWPGSTQHCPLILGLGSLRHLWRSMTDDGTSCQQLSRINRYRGGLRVPHIADAML